MRLKSRGLGRKELVMDFREYAPIREDDEVVMVGTIRDPVNWDFSIRICEDDIAGVMRLVFSKPMLGMLLRRMFRPNKHHWTQSREEHVEEGKRRRIAAQQKAEDRIAANAEAARERTADNTQALAEPAAPKT
ncbi:MAG: hypothetical protein QF570_07980 [Myxococcota bacterium]|jgi:hypothetical protein|nr:hypothetical protein [Myxococcota bacterium]